MCHVTVAEDVDSSHPTYVFVQSPLYRHATQSCMKVGLKFGRLHPTTAIPTRSSGLWTTQLCISALVSDLLCPPSPLPQTRVLNFLQSHIQPLLHYHQDLILLLSHSSFMQATGVHQISPLGTPSHPTPLPPGRIPTVTRLW